MSEPADVAEPIGLDLAGGRSGAARPVRLRLVTNRGEAPALRTGRPIYRHEQLRRLIHPRSIGIIGASEREGSFGLRTVNNLAGFSGTVYPINARYDSVGGLRCYADVSTLPEVPDCVIVAVARDAVRQAVTDCVAAKVGGVIVYASGYAETGRSDLIALQDELASVVRGTATRLLGPNCLGITNYAVSARMMFGRMPAPKPISGKALGIVCQSGSVSMSLGQVVERGIQVSHALPAGNAADVGIADLISYLTDEPTCAAIACVFEGVPEARHVIEAAEMAMAADKPLVVYKMAVGAEGAAAALSHTGSLAGDHATYVAALEQAGAVVVDNLEDVIETAAFLAKAGRPTGHGVGIVLGSGGLGVIAADKAEEFGVPLPQPAGRTKEILEANVPEFGAARNPCDVTAQALNDESGLEACAAAFLTDPAYSTLLVVHPYADAIGTARVALWLRLADRYGKIICNYWSTESLEGEGSYELEAEPRIATFRSLARCFSAVAKWHRREDVRRNAVLPYGRLSRRAAGAHARALLRAAPDRIITERTAKAALSLYDIPVVAERLAQSPAEACQAAAALGFPVVLKADSPDIPHKTEAGVVRLRLASTEDVANGYAEITAKVAAAPDHPRINGVLVQPMLSDGLEIMLGARLDPDFGPIILVAIGGILVELLNDTALTFVPVSQAEALALIRRMKGARLLNGFRHLPRVDSDRLAEIVARFSEFVADNADLLQEVDINPLICGADHITAVDALIVRRLLAAEMPVGPGGMHG